MRSYIQRIRRGAIRKAGESERDLLIKWYDEFYEEALPGLEKIDPQEIARTNLLAGDVYLWIDKEPVCMADVGRKMINGVCVCHVYSPPETRKRGYCFSSCCSDEPVDA